MKALAGAGGDINQPLALHHATDLLERIYIAQREVEQTSSLTIFHLISFFGAGIRSAMESNLQWSKERAFKSVLDRIGGDFGAN